MHVTWATATPLVVSSPRIESIGSTLSLQQNADYSAAKATDGQLQTFSAAQPIGEDGAWISLEIPEGSVVARVIVYNRPDFFYDEANMQVWVSNMAFGDSTSAAARRCVDTHIPLLPAAPPSPIDPAPSPPPPALYRGALQLNCEPAIVGRFVTLRQVGNASLSVAEMELYATPGPSSPPFSSLAPSHSAVPAAPAEQQDQGSNVSFFDRGDNLGYVIVGIVAAVALVCAYCICCMYRHRPSVKSATIRVDVRGEPTALANPFAYKPSTTRASTRTKALGMPDKASVSRGCGSDEPMQLAELSKTAASSALLATSDGAPLAKAKRPPPPKKEASVANAAEASPHAPDALAPPVAAETPKPKKPPPKKKVVAAAAAEASPHAPDAQAPPVAAEPPKPKKPPPPKRVVTAPPPVISQTPLPFGNTLGQ